MASLLDRDLAPRRFTARLTAGFAWRCRWCWWPSRQSRVGFRARRAARVDPVIALSTE
jgi:hypothetical protein